MAKNYLIDYNSASVKNAEDMTRNIERLLSRKKIIDQTRFLTEDNVSYSYTVKTSNEQIQYNILVNRNDELYKSKFDTLYFKTKARLKNIKLFKTRIAACVIAAGVGVTAYNLPTIKEGAKDIIESYNQSIIHDINVDNYENPYPHQPTEEDKRRAEETYQRETIEGQLEKMIKDRNEEQNNTKGL